jgi:hypothetical protein
MAFDALMWFGFGVFAASGGIVSIPRMGPTRWVIGGLAVAAAVALAVTALLLRRRIRIAYFFAIAMLTAIAVLSLTDQVGLLDLASLLVSLVPLVLLLKDRAWYLRRASLTGPAVAGGTGPSGVDGNWPQAPGARGSKVAQGSSDKND